MPGQDSDQDRMEWLRRSRFEAGLILDSSRTNLHHLDHVWHGPQPVNDVNGRDALTETVLQPLSASLEHVEERLDILIAGSFKGSDWTACCGHYAGLWTGPLFGVPATGRPAWLRFGRFERWDGDRIKETWEIFDLPGMMMQADIWPLGPGLGRPLVSPGPATRNGIVLESGSAEEAHRTLTLTEEMIDALLAYDGQDFESMRMPDYWAPHMAWYGPAGIGTMRGYEDYRRGHGKPFLGAFPDRQGALHKCRIAERTYCASTGWPSVQATHSGDTFLGIPATGNRVGMRVMDFWRRDGDLLSENWVYIDMIDLLAQMNVDIFGLMREPIGGS
ncbi:Predicted ester cyclase [Parasphingorhabdus marina DSM 22363]|uniref:Predicted ester cyclase n=2 Tax=Parasphingorhabdus marina TaxID=394732 RepID=A0A1N6D3R8_9SPHN|nr:Predicted ester cyclase [Parasphingorhabdus marina DSM 22363]